jgi:hypothetical protein
MAAETDMRIPIVMGGEAGADDAVLVEDGCAMPVAGYAVRFALASGKPGHVAGCACCTLRGPAADALTAMFRARATGVAPLFKRLVVLASAEGEAAVKAALVEDVVSAARFRLG